MVIMGNNQAPFYKSGNLVSFRHLQFNTKQNEHEFIPYSHNVIINLHNMKINSHKVMTKSHNVISKSYNVQTHLP